MAGGETEAMAGGETEAMAGGGMEAMAGEGTVTAGVRESQQLRPNLTNPKDTSDDVSVGRRPQEIAHHVIK